MKFRQRSYQRELLDDPSVPFPDIRRNMQELDYINTWLGGHAITRRGFRLLFPASPADREICVCEIGSGGGDNLRVLKIFAAQKGMKCRFRGVDINSHCTAYAESIPENEGITFLTSDYRLLEFEEKPDILFASLFCHHFNDEELMQTFAWMQRNSRLGFFINDLQRHPLAFYSIRGLTRIFSRSYLVRHDAPLSVLRGFTRKELETLLRKAGIEHFRIRWQWAFRWLVIVPKQMTNHGD